jgi:FtsH-binding integral membrane protein
MTIAIIAFIASVGAAFLYLKGIIISFREDSFTEEERKSFPVFMALLLGVIINSIAYIFFGLDSILLVLLVPAVAWVVLWMLRDRLIPM